ncbi:uracil-DNA glycosylase [Listeria floridensis FSL S10-1187]|uniref:Uracil-DNA glycosylase n=1 Tax=Listeria floridensis FSL S10-1187 TaxID=1265817 RepID=A0ABP3AZE0_9LIST|nr:uracil-DNA glycosylase [Listeria floridensis]EUJ32946.1 uracil-DNA glycosylase [Listeria floridensis FSL S10-1187]
MTEHEYLQTPKPLIKLVEKRSEGFKLEGFVPGQGKKQSQIMFVGEAPGETEIHNFIPFSGRAGDELMKFMAIAGLTREDVYITSSVRSRPYRWGEKKDRKTGELIKRRYNRAPNQAEIYAQAPILDFEMKAIQPKLIVTLGNIGLRRLLGKNFTVSEIHGELLQQPIQQLASLDENRFVLSEKNYTIIPTFHPASIFYNRKLLPLIEADFKAVGAYKKEYLT